MVKNDVLIIADVAEVVAEVAEVAEEQLKQLKQLYEVAEVARVWYRIVQYVGGGLVPVQDSLLVTPSSVVF